MEQHENTQEMDFHHPFTPYSVQHQFMHTVYEVLEQGDGQVGILESPTGTGKSLSLICAALTWLRHHKRGVYEASVDDAVKSFKDEPEWVVEQLLRRKRAELVDQWEEREVRLKAVRAREKKLEEKSAKRRRIEDQRRERTAGDGSDDEEDWLLQDQEDQDPSQLSSAEKKVKEIMERLGMGNSTKSGEDDKIEDEEQIKIYYTSRTHSQLSQFIDELRRPSFPPSIPTTLLNENASTEPEAVKHLPLSSRQRLCINPKVMRLGALSAINDRCAELQQSKSKDKCQFVPNMDKIALTHQFRDNALASLPDIEDLYNIGDKIGICPYYASRSAIPGAEIITLPYPLLLQKTARDALGIKLEGSVVIIDEAHNIMDAVANVYASEITLQGLTRARQMLGVYVKKFGKKLKGENRVMVGQVARVADGLHEWMENPVNVKGEQGIVDSEALLKSKGIDQINMFRLIQYVQDSKLAYKIEGYAAHIENQDSSTSASPSPSTPVLHTLVSFLESLSNLSSEGRIFYRKISDKVVQDVKLSYLLLSPTHAFSPITLGARAVILAGGTMSPFEDYVFHLFPDLAPGKITTLSCGHVIPPSNLCVWTLASPHPKGHNNRMEFEFSFQKRNDKAMIREFGGAILNACTVVPDGVVVFFPSYGYLEEVVQAWSQSSNPEAPSIWQKLQSKKTVLRETKGGSSDEVLEQYTTAILGNEGTSSTGEQSAAHTSRGALLLSVVGGKMSEGINFSDRLGRCVIIVGLPYPNINSPDWKARIEYIEMTTLKRISERDSVIRQSEATAQAKQAARDFYENACMRAVNQSIGRAIRHRNDYAAIILVDRRFGTDRIRKKLPRWIQGGFIDGSENEGLGKMMGKLNSFFRSKQ
ncbi:DNA repair helicase [Xylariaceae sp. FL0255]|nr:DNA repair helicase [Xylariaceae sp. FL0255]